MTPKSTSAPIESSPINVKVPYTDLLPYADLLDFSHTVNPCTMDLYEHMQGCKSCSFMGTTACMLNLKVNPSLHVTLTQLRAKHPELFI